MTQRHCGVHDRAAMPCLACPVEGLLRGGLEFSPSFIHQVMLWHKLGERDGFLIVLLRRNVFCQVLEKGMPAPNPSAVLDGKREEGRGQG